MPQCPRTASAAAWAKQLGRRDVVTRLEATAVLQLGPALDAHDGGHVGQAQLAGKASVAAEPVDLPCDRNGAFFYAAMSLVEADAALELGLGGIGEESLDVTVQTGLVGLDGQQIVGPRLAYGGGDSAVAGDGVDRQDAALQPTALGQALQQHRNGAEFARFVGDRFLPQNEPAGRGEGRNQMQGAWPAPRSWLRREVLPSMATSSGRSSQQARTQPVKHAENSAGLIRFIMIVSQRPDGTP